MLVLAADFVGLGFVLFYSLLAAYITCTTEIIQHNIKPDIHHYLISILIIMVLGLAVYISISTLDYSNRALLLLKYYHLPSWFLPFAHRSSLSILFQSLSIVIPIFYLIWVTQQYLSHYQIRPKKILITFVLGSYHTTINILWQTIAM